MHVKISPQKFPCALEKADDFLNAESICEQFICKTESN